MKNILSYLSLVIILLCIDFSVSAQTTYFVSPTGNDANNGKSWAGAVASIQVAVDYAGADNPKGQVFVKQGTYPVTSSVNMVEGVNVYGGFDGNETSLSERPILQYGYRTDGGASEISAGATMANPYRVLDQPSAFSSTPTTWDGFVMSGGHIRGGSGAGGVWLYEGGTLSNSTIQNNQASSSSGGGGARGGGIYMIGGTLNDCMVTGNRAENGGGGVYLIGGALNRCIISDNICGDGGGVSIASNSTLHNCIIRNNKSSGTGGGVYCNSGDALLMNCLIHNNKSDQNGGGISVGTATGNIVNCTITNNMAGTYGGGASLNNGVLLYNSIVWGNDDQDHTGSEQIHDSGSPLSVAYCAIQGRYAGADNIYLEAANTGNETGKHYPFFANPTNFTGIASSTEQTDQLAYADWSITYSSACKDAGDPLTTGLLSADLAGNPRICNSIVDIGAYEFQTYLIKGLVKDTLNNPVNNAVVYIFPIESKGEIIPTLATINGNSYTATVPAEYYIIQATAPGYQVGYYNDSTISSPVDWKGATIVNSSGEYTIRLIHIETPAGNLGVEKITVKGIVQDDGIKSLSTIKAVMARPVAYATVVLYGKSKSKSAANGQNVNDNDPYAGYKIMAQTQTDDQGNFLFDPMPKDYDYLIKVELPGYTMEAPIAINPNEANNLYEVSCLANTDTHMINGQVTGTTSARTIDAVSVQLYPNPAVDVVRIIVDTDMPYMIRVFNTIGQQLMVMNGMSRESNFDISILQPGIYFVRIEAGGKMGTYKLIKK